MLITKDMLEEVDLYKDMKANGEVVQLPSCKVVAGRTADGELIVILGSFGEEHKDIARGLVAPGGASIQRGAWFNHSHSLGRGVATEDEEAVRKVAEEWLAQQ